MHEPVSSLFASAFQEFSVDQWNTLDHYEELVIAEAIPRGLVGFPVERVGSEIARSLLLASLLNQKAPLIDVGSGAGFPGVPLCIARDTQAYLIEPRRAAAAFLERVIRDLHLNATVVAESAEKAGRSDLRETANFVVARSVAPLPVALELTAPLCRIGGRIVVTASPAPPPAVSDELLKELGVSPPGRETLTGPLDLVQHVHIIEKLETTSSDFPRRPGRARRG